MTITPNIAEDSEMTSRFVVITGGPGSGKTSLVNYLASLGYATVPESAIQLIDELNRERGIQAQIEWRKQHPAEFTRLVMVRMDALEAACTVGEHEIAFCDRGRPDALAYSEIAGTELGREIWPLIEGRRYLRVFLLDTLSDFPARPDTGRTSNRERSLRLHDLLLKAYRSLGYQPFRVPELSIKDRAQLVLSELAAGGLLPEREEGKFEP